MRSRLQVLIMLAIASTLLVAGCGSVAKPAHHTAPSKSPTHTSVAAPINVPFPAVTPPAGVQPLSASAQQAVQVYLQARVNGPIRLSTVRWAKVSLAGSPPYVAWEIALVGKFYQQFPLACPSGVASGTAFSAKVPVFTTGFAIVSPTTKAVLAWDPTGQPSQVMETVKCGS